MGKRVLEPSLPLMHKWPDHKLNTDNSLLLMEYSADQESHVYL